MRIGMSQLDRKKLMTALLVGLLCAGWFGGCQSEEDPDCPLEHADAAMGPDARMMSADVLEEDTSEAPDPGPPGATTLEPVNLSSDPWEVPAPFQNPVCKLEVDPCDFELMSDNEYDEIELPARLELHGSVYDIELELHGDTSRVYDKKSFKLKFKEAPFVGDPFREGIPHESYGRLVLKAMFKDQSLVREAITFDAWRGMGYHAPRHSHCNLHLNGVFWGLYVVVERIDEEFVARRGYAPGGAMYKGVKQKANFRPIYNADLSIGWEKKTHKKDPWDDLMELILTLQETPKTPESFLAEVDPTYPIDRYFDRMIWVSVTQNIDHTEHNFYLYRQPPELGAWWVLFPWDADVSLATHWSIKQSSFEFLWKHNLDGGNYYGRRLVAIDSLREQYVERFEQLLDGALHADTLAAIAENRIAQVDEDLVRDLERWPRPTSTTAEQEFDEIRGIIKERNPWLRSLLPLFLADPALHDEPWIDN